MPQFQLEWVPKFVSDTTDNDSDKAFTVPSNKHWEVQWVWVELVSSGTAGNRQIVVEIQDGSTDVIALVNAGAVQAASVTRNYLFSPYVGDLTSFRNTTYLTNPIPNFILRPGYIVRVYDKTAVDAAADDMVVHMMVREYGA